MARESMSVDVVIVGAGPAGLATACRLMQLAKEAGRELSVCVLEKGSEVGAHILSGAVFEPAALTELFPDWQAQGASLKTPVSADEVYYLGSATGSFRFPGALVPRSMRNEGNFIISLGNLCRWLAEQAGTLGVDIFPGFAAAELLYDADGGVRGVATGDQGVAANGERKDSYQPGFEFHARYTVLAEGCRGHLGKEVISRYRLDEGRDPQHYGLGIKEVWEIPPERHRPGLVMHTAGYPMIGASAAVGSGGFLYHQEDRRVSLGLIVDLGYGNPHISPVDEFSRFKHHPLIRQFLDGGQRLAYGARAVNKGGLGSLPRLSFPGGLLVGCDAGTLNPAKIKGSHTALRSGMLAAETLFEALAEDSPPPRLQAFDEGFARSSVGAELRRARNFSAGFHKFGFWLGSALAFVEQNLLFGRTPLTLRDREPDHCRLKPAADSPPIRYPKPDGVISFDRLSSVYQSNTNHGEDQPCHLRLRDPAVPIDSNLPRYDEPAQRYCPAGVYEVVAADDGGRRFQINAQNCVHCKTCDIKDPEQNIDWTVPEGGGGPNYSAM